MDELPVGIRECARQLGVNASTISRQVASGVIPNRAGEGQQPKVLISEARSAREQGLDRSKQRGADAPLLAFADRAPALPRRSKELHFQAVRTQREAFRAREAQLDL